MASILARHRYSRFGSGSFKPDACTECGAYVMRWLRCNIVHSAVAMRQVPWLATLLTRQLRCWTRIPRESRLEIRRGPVPYRRTERLLLLPSAQDLRLLMRRLLNDQYIC